MPESLAYFWSTLALYLVARAPAPADALDDRARGRRRPDRPAGAGATAKSLDPRGGRSPRSSTRRRAPAGGRRSPRGRPRERLGRDRARASALVIAADVLVAHHSYEWFIGTHFWHRAFTYGLWAFGALAIGLGVLPVLLRARLGARRADRDARGPRAARRVRRRGRSASASTPRSRRPTSRRRSAIRVEERNLIYLSPIVFVAAAALC